MSYVTSLVALKGAVEANLDLVDPLASDRSHLRWQRDKVPCTSALQGSNLLRHGDDALPVRVDNSLSISGGLNKRSSSEAIAIRRMDSTTVTKSILRGRVERSNKRGRGSCGEGGGGHGQRL